MPLRVATYNIHGGTDAGRRPSLPTIADSLQKVNPDLVFLQEVDHHLPRSGFRDQARWLARRLGYPTCHFYGRFGVGAMAFGNAVLARVTPLRRLNLPLLGGGEPRCAAGLVLPDGTVVYSVHLGLREEWRADQLDSLLQALDALPPQTPVLIGGDFNALRDAPEIAAFLQRSTLVALGSDAPTFPASLPTSRIDFLLASAHFTSDASDIAADLGSDHCLLWADLNRTDSGPAS